MVLNEIACSKIFSENIDKNKDSWFQMYMINILFYMVTLKCVFEHSC